MSEIVISEFMDEAAVGRLCSSYDTNYDPTLVDRPDELASAIANARALIVRNRTQVNTALLRAGTSLEVVGRLGVGLDNIDLAECENCGIGVIPATGANDLSVAEYVITTAQVLLRGAYNGAESVLAGEWPRQSMIGRELSGRTMGLLGYGAIAREVATRAQGLGMEVIAHDPHLPAESDVWGAVRPVSLVELANQSDVLSLHVPLNAGTRHIIDQQFIAGMKPDAILINAARGGVVDENALSKALINNELGGAALDVFETEPLTAEAGAKFAGLSNLVLTPHIAGVTEESNVRVSNLIADKVLEKLQKA